MTALPTRRAVLDNLRWDGAREYIADNFGKYAYRGDLARFLVRYELFKKVIDVQGSIVECGVKNGAGLISWWHLARLLDPYGVRRAIFGFDTFEGFPSVSEKDGRVAQVGDMPAPGIFEELNHLVVCHDNYEKIFRISAAGEAAINLDQLYQAPVLPIKGDFLVTGDAFIKDNPHVILSLVYLDFDLYEPTKKAIELFLPRMPKGAVLAFDEVNHRDWPGETLAVLETIGIRSLELKKFSFDINTCYAVV